VAAAAAAAAAAHRASALRGAPPATVIALTPRHRLGCKRVLLSDTFLRSLATAGRAAVETGTLVAASARALHLADGRAVPADVVVLCTGYVAPAWLAGLDVVGRGGVSLAQAWADAGRPSAFLGAAVPGFPNFFMLGGPGSGTGFHSVLAFVEAQVAHAVAALRLLGWWQEDVGRSFVCFLSFFCQGCTRLGCFSRPVTLSLHAPPTHTQTHTFTTQQLQRHRRRRLARPGGAAVAAAPRAPPLLRPPPPPPPPPPSRRRAPSSRSPPPRPRPSTRPCRPASQPPSSRTAGPGTGRARTGRAP